MGRIIREIIDRVGTALGNLLRPPRPRPRPVPAPVRVRRASAPRVDGVDGLTRGDEGADAS